MVEDLGVGHPHPVAVAALRHQERGHVHVLDAPGHDHVRVTERYLLRRRDYGLKARAAHPVQRHAGDLDGEAALYADLAAGVHALAGGEDVADYDLIDLVALYPRPAEDLFPDRRPKIGRRRVL